MGEAALLEERILEMLPSGKTCSIYLAVSCYFLLFLTYITFCKVLSGSSCTKKSIYDHSSPGFCSVSRGSERKWRAAQSCAILEPNLNNSAILLAKLCPE